MTQTRIVVVIPTYNCESQIFSTLTKVNFLADFFDEVWIIDNGSKDQTLRVAQSFIDGLSFQNDKFVLFQNRMNISLGGTSKVAFRMAVEKSFTHLLVVHGDDQANPKDFLSILTNPDQLGEKVSFFGSRFSLDSSLHGYRLERIFGNLVLNFIYSMFTFKFLTDLGSGLNLYNLKQLEELDLSNLSNSMSFNYDLLLSFIAKDLEFKYIPISWRESNQISNAKNFKVFVEALRILIRWRFNVFKKVVSTEFLEYPKRYKI